MRPTWTISDIFETPARARVLRTLALMSSPHSVRRVASLAGISHTAAGAVLGDLDAMGLVSRHVVGRAHVYALERSNIYVRSMVLPAVEAERLVVNELCRDLRDEFAHDSLSLILFGSYAFGEQDESSDIDVFALVEGALQKQRLEERGRECGLRFRMKYSSPLSLMVYTKAQADAHLLNGKSAFGTELASTGIILHGLGVEEWGNGVEESEDSDSLESRGKTVDGESAGVR